MTPTRTSLVVGHDGSPNAAHALDVAADLAQSLSARLRVVRAWGIDPNPAVAELLLDESLPHDRIGQEMRHSLEADCAAVVARHPDLPVSYDAISGPAASVLCAASANEWMLVVGARGVGGLPGLLLGSISDRCLRLSTRPVLVVPRRDERPEKKAAPADGDSTLARVSAIPALSPGTIVVGYDGSPHADAALEEALILAERTSAPLAVVQSWSFDTAPAGVVWKDGAVSSFPEIAEEIQQRLAARVAPRSDAHPTVAVECFAMLGQPSEVLVALSKTASMLVLGSRGLGGFSGLVLGSVSLHCTHRARCAVLVVPHPTGR